MGQFSWLDCKTKEQIVDNALEDVYVLVPKEFRNTYGTRIKETLYDGYGDFGGYDIYDLVYEWNKEHIRQIYEEKKIEKYLQVYAYNEETEYFGKQTLNSLKEIQDYIDSDREHKRELGICIACYDEDNASLKYPIKITHDANAIYEDCEISLSDPNQGWRIEEDEEDDEYWY